MLFLFGRLISLGKFILELAVIKNATYRRTTLGSHLNQVQAEGLGPIQRLADGQNADLLAVRPNQSDWRDSYPAVYP
jgi:hypothetical protein